MIPAVVSARYLSACSCALALAGATCAPALRADVPPAPDYQQSFRHDGERVEVTANADGEYEIRVYRGDDLAARLAGTPKGILAAATLTDLDADGQFEVTLLFQDPQQSAQLLRVYEWNERYLALVEIPEPGPETGYRGGGRYRIDGDRLLLEFSAYRDGDADPDGKRVRLRFDFAANRWESRSRRWLDKLPFVGDD
ncbi:MAG: hypothetical protein IT495_00620 [Gammaproteobacteria bacterium]|nr:hypothetical protein [Gammaproteobacteria bacterium]